MEVRSSSLIVQWFPLSHESCPVGMELKMHNLLNVKALLMTDKIILAALGKG